MRRYPRLRFAITRKILILRRLNSCHFGPPTFIGCVACIDTSCTLKNQMIRPPLFLKNWLFFFTVNNFTSPTDANRKDTRWFWIDKCIIAELLIEKTAMEKRAVEDYTTTYIAATSGPLNQPPCRDSWRANPLCLFLSHSLLFLLTPVASVHCYHCCSFFPPLSLTLTTNIRTPETYQPPTPFPHALIPLLRQWPPARPFYLRSLPPLIPFFVVVLSKFSLHLCTFLLKRWAVKPYSSFFRNGPRNIFFPLFFILILFWLAKLVRCKRGMLGLCMPEAFIILVLFIAG